MVCGMTDVGVVGEVAARRLDRRVALRQRRGRMPSLVEGVVRDGCLAWWGARGDVPSGVEPIRVGYRIGSITKTFVAVAVLRLRDEGFLGLDDAVGDYVPGLSWPDVSVRRLLTHSGGVAAELPGSWWERSPGVDGQALRAAGAVVQPGFHYSNVGFAVLGELVARCRGRDWFEVVASEILRPLGMGDTSLLPVGVSARGLAVHPFADVVMPEVVVDARAMGPAGQLWSSVADLGVWSAFLAGDTGDVLARDTWREMCHPHVVSDVNGWSGAQGLGVQLRRDGGRVVVGHGGSMPGFQAGVWADVESATGWAGVWNCTAAAEVSGVDDPFDIMDECQPRLPEPWVAVESVPEALLAIAGVWFWGTSQTEIHVEADGGLRVEGVSGMARGSRFRPAGDGTWTGLDGYLAGERLTVVRDQAGDVSHVEMATFVLTRRPYEPGGVIPGGVPQGWPVS